MAVSVAGKVLLDTNVFIDYLRLGRHADWIAGRVEGTVRYLSAVVLMELRLGAETPVAQKQVDHLRNAFPDSRLVAPLAESFDRAATLFRRMHGAPRRGADRLGPMNDLLIALTAWRIGATVVTSNRGDFQRIATHVPGLRVVAP